MIKIGILSITQILFIVIIFGILIYLQSQQTLLGNTINIAGKNRYLTTNILYQISEYLGQPNTQSTTTTTDENKKINYKDNISKIKVAEQQLDSNIMALKNGGNISNIQLQPIPSEFMNSWNVIYQKWQNFKSVLEEKIYKNSQDKVANFQNKTSSTLNKKSNDSIKQEVYPLAFELFNLSDSLVTQLGQSAKKNIDNLVLLQFVFGSMNVLLILFILHLVSRMLKPVFLLTKATFEVKKGNLDISVNYKRNNDEFAFLIRSFNSMIETIKSDIKKQNELANQLRLLNSQLKIANTAKDDFINTAAHELRSPIQSIIVSSSLLLEKVKEFEQRKLFDIVYRNSKKLKILIQNLLDVPKIESNSLKLNKEKFYLNGFLLDIIKDYENTYCYFHDYKFRLISSENDDFLIYADKNRISQVIYNLIDNSIKYITEGGIISIILEKKKINNNDNNLKEFVIIHIKDTGSGIDTEVLSKVFTKFGTKSSQGTGLGLYISKNIIEAHGGRIWAKNNDDGKGAIFSFSLPLNN